MAWHFKARVCVAYTCYSRTRAAVLLCNSHLSLLWPYFVDFSAVGHVELVASLLQRTKEHEALVKAGLRSHLRIDGRIRANDVRKTRLSSDACLLTLLLVAGMPLLISAS